MSDFAPGDVVVCVDDSPCRCCGDELPVTLRATYRVEQAQFGVNRPTKRRILALVLAGVQHGTAHHWRGEGINAERFRRIERASESFTRQIRACRPIKTKVPA